ncbi:M14 family zinc carboxypeptidase [Halomonas denitrificans]|nr:hypothetical protein [Halomonas denitrificans]
MIRTAAALLALFTAAPALPEVVRIHDLSPAELGTLRAEYDFWGVDWRAGYAVFDLDPADRARLEATGFRIEADRPRQRDLERWNAIDRTGFGRGDPGTIPGFPCYRTVTQTHADLGALAAQHPDRAQWVDIGDSWQAANGSVPGSSIFAVVIGNENSSHPRAPLVLMAAQHARELATAEIATRWAELLVENPDDDPDIEWLLDHREIHVIAQQNPDGRRQVESGESFWRKNHNETACPGGPVGVDLNRNSTHFWGNASSGSTCSETYRGPVVASEPETQALQAYLLDVFADQRPGDQTTPAPPDTEGLFISLHSFGELVLLPWEGLGGQNENNAPNHDALTVLGRRMAWHGDYEVSRWFSLGPAGGTMVDFAYYETGVAAYTFEVGTTFQQSCASFESTVWPDNRNALLLAAKAARRPYREPAGPAITALGVSLDNGAVRLVGTADDTRYFRGNSPEPPAADPIADVVTVRVASGAPAETGAPSWDFSLPVPAPVADFNVVLPAGASPAPNGRLFVTAIDAGGESGLPRVARLPLTLFSDGFES